MIDTLKNFATVMISTVMMIAVIKMIIPEGKNKKYLLFVCGMITTVVMMNPLLAFMNLDINEVLAKNQSEYEEVKVDESLYQNAIKSSYEESFVQDVIQRLKENGYHVSHVRVEYDASGYTPQKIFLNLEDAEGYVQPVKIEVSNNNRSSKINEYTKSKIQEIIQSHYGIEKNNIFIEK